MTLFTTRTSFLSFCRTIAIAVLTLAWAMPSQAVVSTANYTFATGGAASFTDMSSGTTTLVAVGLDDTVSASTNIGFDFFLMGTRYSTFTTADNGIIQLGSAISGTLYIIPSTTLPLITAFGNDMRVGSDGAVVSKVTGSAPNRVLTIQWTNNMIRFLGAAAPGTATFQVRLYENTGVIEYVYGTMTTNAASPTVYYVGFSVNTTVNNLVTVNTTANTASTAAAATTNSYTASSTITQLNSPTDGSRKNYTFTPPVPNPATGFSITGTGLNTMTLNWTDSSNEQGYAIYRSTDGGTTYSFFGTAAQNATSFVANGLTGATTYFWQVYAISEGALSTSIGGSDTTLTPTPISGTKTVCPSGCDFATLTAAFNYVAGNGVNGALVFELQGTYTSGAETFPITATNISGNSVSNTITVRPAPAAPGLSISGSNATGPIIDLNGARNVIIDGQTGGTGGLKQLTIANTNATGQTLRFINDASNNTVQFCVIQGVTTSTTSGVVLFSTTTGTTGNDNNIISNNDITKGATTPTNGVYSSGTTTTTTLFNSGNQVSNNNIFDFFSAISAPSGVLLSSGTTDWTINANRFYQTATRTFTTTGLRYAAIGLTSGTSSFYTVTNNIIGFGAADGTGTTTITGLGNIIRAIDTTSLSTATPTSIQGNTISGINQTTTNASTSTLSGPFIGIMLGSTGGAFNVGNISGNNIGSLDGSSTIVVNESSITASTAPFMGIYDFSVTGNNISNNNIGSITIQGTGTTVGFFGIFVNTTTGTTATLSNNTIASITDTLVGGYAMYGIRTSLGNANATGNTIRNFTGSGTTAATIIQAGILASGSTGVNTIARNTVHSLSNVTTSANTNSIYGISLALPATANVVERNFIHSLNISGAGTAGSYQTWGISGGATGTATYRNNMIRLGLKADGTAMTFGASIIGIRDAAGATNQYFNNSVYVGGSGVVSSANTYCFFSDVVTVVHAIENNIFWNARSNASGGIANLAIRVAGTAPNPTGLTSNYNDLFFSGTDGALGVYNSLIVPDIATWRTNTGQDALSINADPLLINPAGTAAAVDLHLNRSGICALSPAENKGLTVGAVTNDFDNDLRANPPDIGADEVTDITACDDGNACTTGDACSLGSCVGTPVVCDDGNACTDDACVLGSCVFTNDDSNTCGDPSDNVCDGPDFCSAGACNPNYKSAATECRGAAGTCDVAEFCTGVSAGCPADALVPGDTECRGVAGACDIAESCTGSSPNCPADVFEPNTTICRGAAGVCDAAESCTGTGPACPADLYQPAATACDGISQGGACDNDAADQCNGTSIDCQDAYQPNTTTCRPSTGACDAAESCTGTSGACPADGFEPSSTSCTGVSQGGLCDNDAADHCSGTGNTCEDAYQPNTYTCRAAASGCDVAEVCTGTSGACPADVTGGPVSVTASAGTPGPTSYANLNAAFSAINAGTHQGAIDVSICSSISEGTSPANLNSTGAGSAVYTSVNIHPAAPGITVTGNPVTGFGVIQLNGADNVTIDGDDPNTAGINRDLTINNTAAATVVANSVVRIAVSTTGVTSADNDTIKNCNLNGNVTGGNSSLITSTTGSSGISFVVLAGGGGGATAVGAPVAVAAAGGTAAPSGTTINGLLVTNNAINQAARGVVFNGAATTVSTGVTVTNNTIGASGTPTPATPPYITPTTTIYNRGVGISGTVAATVTGNTIQNIISYVGIGMSGVEMSALIGTGPIAVSNNTINTVVLNSTAALYTRGVSMLASTTSYTVGGNTITNIQNFSGSSANQPGGIFVNTAATSGTIENNKVTTVNNRNTSTFGSHGISLSGGNNVTVRNNFVSDVTQNMTGGAAFSGTFGTFGLRIAAGTGHKVYHNSINLFGALAGTATTGNLSAAFGISATGLTGIDVRNNIFSNTMTGGSGSSAHVAVFLPSSGTTVNMNLTENNNAYYSGSVAGFSGIAHVGTTYTAVPVGSPTYAGLYTAANFNPTVATGTLNFRFYTNTLSAAATNDNASLASTSAAPFTTATDLHINTGLTNTPLESTGAAVGITSDIDGQLRPGPAGSVNGGATAPDLGADEFDGVPLLANDLAATAFIDPVSGGTKGAGIAFSPQASFTNAGTATQTNVTVRYRIIDSSPAEVYNQTAVIASIASNVTTTVTFPSASLPAGNYVIKAKAELVGDSQSSNDEITGTLIVEAPLAGSYDVGTGGAYTSLTNPGGAFEKLNALGATGNVVLNITSDLTGELGTNALNEVAGGFTVTIKPAGGPRQIVGSNAGALIRLNGADGVTIEGSTTGATATGIGGNAAIRELTIQNTNVGTSAVVIAVGSGTNGAQNNTIRNVIVLGQDPTTTLAAVALGGNTPGTVGTDNDNNHIENCSVRRAIYGIYTAGLSAANPNVGTVITMNETSAVTADRIRRIGMAIFNEDQVQVTFNSLNGISTTEAADAVGIGLGAQAVDTTVTTTGAITNALVSRNRINGVASLVTTGFSAVGIAVSGNTGGANTIVNNMITGVIAPATSPDVVAGVFVVGAAGSQTRVYDNSISMTGDRGAVASQLPSFGIAVTGTDPTLELKNNIFYTTQVATGGGTGAKSYAIGMVTTTFANLDSNFNDFWSTGANDGGFRSGSLAAAAGTDYATLAAWRTAVSDDAASVEADPIFVSPTSDLHLNLAGPGSAVENAGVFLASVPTDIDGELRHPTTPDIGADELRCHTVFDPACNDNNACTVDSCDPATGCGAVAGNTGAVCRAAATACDVAELCDGSSVCPTDVFASADTACSGLSQAGACDNDAFDHCSGTSAACVDVFQPNTVECRGSAGVCDVAESCTGSSGSCPVDAFVPSDTLECRPSAGSCDVAESCSGASAVCPADGFASVSTSCTGTSNGDVCDGADHCSGTGNTCVDAFESNAVTCRASAGVCDAAETCTGSSGACPADGFAPDTTLCTGVSQGGVCDNDAADHCTGTSNACADAYQGPTFECRASTAMCDPAEFCTGTASTCPADSVGQSAPVGQTVAVSHNKVTNTSTISWTEVTPGPFNVYRGTIRPYQPFAYNQTCFAYGVAGSSTSDMRRPSPGSVSFYLISRTQTPCSESNIGQDSVGTDRPNPLVCPTPPPDTDGDGFQDNLDNCPTTYNPSQNDIDQDGRGDVCDNCPIDPNADQADADHDNIGDVCDF